MQYFCQNLKEHKDNKPVEVGTYQIVCHECDKMLDWTKEYDIDVRTTFTRPVYPINSVKEL